MYNKVNYRFKVYKWAICYAVAAWKPLLLRKGTEYGRDACWGRRNLEFVVVNKKGIERIPMDEILYFEKEKRKVHLHTQTERRSFYAKFSDVIRQTNQYFMRCHNSYVVNIAQAQKLVGRKFFFADGTAIPISQTYYGEIRQAYLDYLGCDCEDGHSQNRGMLEKDAMEK